MRFRVRIPLLPERARLRALEEYLPCIDVGSQLSEVLLLVALTAARDVARAYLKNSFLMILPVLPSMVQRYEQ